MKRISGRCLHSNGFRTGMQATLCCEKSADEIEFGRFPTRKRMKTQPAVEKPFFQPAVEKRKAAKRSKPFWLRSFRAMAIRQTQRRILVKLVKLSFPSSSINFPSSFLRIFLGFSSHSSEFSADVLPLASNFSRLSFASPSNTFHVRQSSIYTCCMFVAL